MMKQMILIVWISASILGVDADCSAEKFEKSFDLLIMATDYPRNYPETIEDLKVYCKYVFQLCF